MDELKISNSRYMGNLDCFQNLIDIDDFFGWDDDSLLNLKGMVETNPFNMLVIALSIKRCRPFWGKASYYPPKNEKTDKYLQYMGFYETCGIPNRDIQRGGRRMGKYICITKIDLSPQGSISADYDMIEYEAKQLARMFQFDKKLADYLLYCFFEMIRNVYEHAKTNHVYVCAQYWPMHSLMEIAIADEGCGIQKAMQKRYSNMSEQDLINHAMKPGISALTNHSYLEKDDPYGNSGYGLYITKELALAYGGSFILCSGNYAKRYYKKGYIPVEKDFSTKFQGTAIAIRFRTDMNIDFNETITKIKDKAESKSKSIEGAIHKASKSSGGKRQ